MCGIAGQVHWQGGVDVYALQRVVDGLAHRGPDDEGMWRQGAGVCALGHRRLSVIDLSPLGHQPMIDRATGNVIIFNGEIYNFLELRKVCEAYGDRFESESDTEVILALYRRHGAEFVKHLRGMFALALWDETRRRLLLTRDRAGKKPLHYALTPDGVLFASELFPLSRHPAVSDDMDPEALELYLQQQSVPAPWTIYRQVRKLPPAHFALVDESGLRIEPYWDVDYRPKIEVTEEEALDGLEEKLLEATRLRMISDVPLGALLSGGVDSSLIVALMAKASDQPVRTFSIGFDEQVFNELDYAEQAAGICGTIHHPEIVHGDVAHVLPTIARHYGEPFADSSAVPSFFVSQMARKHVTVVLNGDGGDELLGGYPRYALPAWAIAAGTRIAPLIGPDRVSEMARWPSVASLPKRVLRRIARGAASPEVGSWLMYMVYWAEPERAALLGSGFDPELLPRWRRDWMSRAFERADNPIDRMLWLDNRTYLPDDLLVKMDIAAMHCGLEARSPLLDHEVIEYCASLPVGLKVKGGTGKYLLKKLAERYFPADFVHRPKMGFGIPAPSWLKGPLRQMTEDIILDADLMEPLDPAVIRATWQRLLEPVARDDYDAGRVWALLMYGLWRQL